MTVKIVTAQSWREKVASSEVPVVVNFSAARCGFCMALDPLYKILSEYYKGKMVFLKLMVDDPQNHEILRDIAIEGTPTLKFYCKGREIGEHVGYAIQPVLVMKIEAFLQEMEHCLQNSTPLSYGANG